MDPGRNDMLLYPRRKSGMEHVEVLKVKGGSARTASGGAGGISVSVIVDEEMSEVTGKMPLIGLFFLGIGESLIKSNAFFVERVFLVEAGGFVTGVITSEVSVVQSTVSSRVSVSFAGV